MSTCDQYWYETSELFFQTRNNSSWITNFRYFIHVQSSAVERFTEHILHRIEFFFTDLCTCMLTHWENMLRIPRCVDDVGFQCETDAVTHVKNQHFYTHSDIFCSSVSCGTVCFTGHLTWKSCHRISRKIYAFTNTISKKNKRQSTCWRKHTTTHRTIRINCKISELCQIFVSHRIEIYGSNRPASTTIERMLLSYYTDPRASISERISRNRTYEFTT